MNNLLISYDLNTPGQNYAKVIEAIKSLGTWAHVHKSFWYVKSSHGAEYARNEIWKAMDESDTVYVVDATNNTAAWQNLNSEVSTMIQNHWAQKPVFAV
jgi:hypothetical protein